VSQTIKKVDPPFAEVMTFAIAMSQELQDFVDEAVEDSER